MDSSGLEADGGSFYTSISGDGRYVAFSSGATNLVGGDGNGRDDIFVHDRTSGVTERVSVDSSGVESNDGSSDPSISADGGYVAFYSPATNLVAGDGNGSNDIFVHDRTTGVTERVSVDSLGLEGNGFSSNPSISSDGCYVAFYSSATNLVTGDTNGTGDIFVHDCTTAATERVSVDSSGVESNDHVFNPSISGDGLFVAFQSSATNLVAGDLNGSIDIFIHDRSSGDTTRASVNSVGTEGNSTASDPSISGDGRYVAFESYADNLVAGDSNGEQDVFVHDSSAPVAPTPTPTPTAAPDEDGQTCSQEINSGSTTVVNCGRIRISVPASAIPAGEKNCKIFIKEKGTSGQYGFSLDDTVWDVKIICDSGEVTIFFAPVTVCIRPKDGITTDKQVFQRHKGGSAFAPMAPGEGPGGYACGSTQTFSLFTLGELTLPDTGFAPGLVTELAEQPADRAYAASDLMLNIPKLGVEMDIVGVPLVNGDWDVSWLASSQAGYLYGTAYPTWVGNSVLTAHVWNADNTAGPFNALKNLQHGDQFTITAWGSTYTYEVRSNQLVSERNLNVMAHSDYALVTLITCETYNEGSGEYLYRRAVQAILISVD